MSSQEMIQPAVAPNQYSLPYGGSFLKHVNPPTPPSSNTSSHAPSFECPVCQRRFASRKYLSMHAALHKMAPPVVSGDADDDVTGRPMQCRGALPVTLVGRHGNGSTQSWSCPVCGKTFAQNSNFRNHVRTHSDERPYVCLVCFIGFKERYHLKKHALFKHSGELKEQCRQCGKRFKDLTAVRAHERTHSDLRPYQCERCNKTFKTSECLWHHENRSKTCGRSPSDVISGGRRRHLAVSTADSRSRSRRGVNMTDRQGANNERLLAANGSSAVSTSVIKVETNIHNKMDLVNDFGLDLELDSDLSQFNCYGANVPWSVPSHSDVRPCDDQYDFRHSAIDDVTTVSSDCFLATSGHPQFSIDCDNIEFQLNNNNPLTSLSKQFPVVDNMDEFNARYDVKTLYDVIDNDIIDDTRSNSRFTASACQMSRDFAMESCSDVMPADYRETPDVDRQPSTPIIERHSGHVVVTQGWCPSLPTAIVAPIQRCNNQRQQQQRLHSTISRNTEKFLLPPFETFVPPRKSRDVISSSTCCKTTRYRPQQQFPTVTRYLLQTAPPPRHYTHQDRLGHVIQYEDNCQVDGMLAML